MLKTTSFSVQWKIVIVFFFRCSLHTLDSFLLQQFITTAKLCKFFEVKHKHLHICNVGIQLWNFFKLKENTSDSRCFKTNTTFRADKIGLKIIFQTIFSNVIFHSIIPSVLFRQNSHCCTNIEDIKDKWWYVALIRNNFHSWFKSIDASSRTIELSP